ncbi:MAG TPA: Uma2 family endonuclease [Gemmataceae bacterium]|nr:Uma2 family endonuclease [Gemmataceae bacterium]
MIFKSHEEPDKDLYPDDDGLPMADNTLQYEWIVTIKGNMDALFRHDPNVFVGGNLLWYAVEGEPTICTAPDALVVFGRPKGYRGSYMQWREDDIAPQIVFEILSPSNRDADMARKLEFYDHYGVEEYYLYDPEEVVLSGWQRVEGNLQAVSPMHGWTSPRLGIRFDMSGEELVIFGPDNEPFLPFVAVKEQQEQERLRADQAERRAREAEEQARLSQEQARLSQEQAQHAQEQAQHAQQRAEQLAARLRALGVDPDA